MTTAILRLPYRIASLPRLSLIVRAGLAARGSIGAGLAVKAGGAAAVPSWWLVAGKTCIAAYQPKGAGSLPLSYVNLANPGTYDAAPGVAPTWASATGWTGNGSTMYLDTGWTPEADQSKSILIRYSGYTSGADIALSSIYIISGTLQSFGIIRSNANTAYFRNGSQLPVTITGQTAGVLAVAGNKAYINGVDGGISISSDSNAFSGTLPILAGWNNGSIGNYFAGSVQAVAIYSDTLTAGEVAVVSAAMAAL